MNKRFTEKTAAACFNRLLKNCAKAQPGREPFHSAWIDKSGRQCACDGYRAYRLNTALDAIQTNRERIPMDLEKIFAPLDAGKVKEIPAPDPEAIRLAIIDGKNHDRPGYYDFGPGLPAFNPEYLREILRLYPAGKWFIEEDEKRRLCSPAFVVDAAGSACLCPVRKKQQAPKEEPAAEDPAPVPAPDAAPAPETVPAEQEQEPEKAPETAPAPAFKKFTFFVYAKFAGDRNFSLADPFKGYNKLKVIYAPRFTEQDLPRLKAALEYITIMDPGAAFQIRTIDTRKTVYTTTQEAAVFTPEDFSELFAA